MKTIEIFVEIKNETEKAFLLTDGVIEMWVPKSLIENYEEISGNECCNVEIPEWLAKEKGFI